MARRHGQDRGGEQDCGYAASLGQRKRVAHIPTADAKAAASCLILKDKGRRHYTLTPAPPGPASGVHFIRWRPGTGFNLLWTFARGVLRAMRTDIAPNRCAVRPP